VRLAADDHLVQALATQCANQTFRNAILPRRVLTKLSEGQEATVLQLPAQSTTAAEVDAQKHIAYVG
jgi:hypothetical protein